MKPGVPWSVKGIDPEVRAAAKRSARRAGMTLGEWLNGVILDQNGNRIDSALGQTTHPEESFLSSTPQDPGPSLPDGAPRDEQPRRPSAARRDDSALRLQDIARQLADLAQKERQSVPVRPYEPERRRPGEDEEAFARVLERVDDNERQTVEALTAVNERLSMLAQQIVVQPRAEPFVRPEDVPGYTALESAIRNVVEHIEVSEKRTRDSLKAMQDRLGELAEQSARQPAHEDHQRTAPVLAQLEARVAELSNRLQRTESTLQAGMPEQLRREFGQIVERIDSVKASADQMARQAQTAATGIARSELREIETRVLATLKEAQAAAGAPGAASPEFGQLKGEIGGLSRRMDEIKANSATERDLHALRIAVEHLSSRVAQVPDVRPLADMDRRLAELGQRVEQAIRQQSDPRTFDLLEQNIAAVGERVGRTEEQLRHIETMEQAIRQLYASLEQSREITSQTAEEAASRTVERMLSSGLPSGAPAGRSPELKALEDGLRAVRESAAGAERRNQDTLAAVHETLSQIVEKIAELESGSGGAALPSAAAAHAFAPEPPAPPSQPQPGHYHEAPAYTPEPATANSGAAPLAAGDDFIAAARRAAQAAASRPSALRAEFGPVVQAPEEEGGLSLLRRFHKREKPEAADLSGSDPLRKPAKDQATAARRRRLLLAGVVLLAAVSAFAFNMLVRKQTPPAPPPSAIEAPVQPQQQPELPPERQGLIDLPSEPIVTGSLPAPGAANSVRLPPPETGTEALRRAAVNGNAAAQFIIASRYFDGEGIAPDAATAALWYEQAAGSGLAPAQYRLGTLYERGKGVAQDAGLALSWYERAARQGNVKSMHNAAVVIVGGQAGPVDHGKAFALFSAAAERGLRDSQFNLAILHERGMGTKEDKAEAVFWYRLAALQGDTDAAGRAATLSKSLRPETLSGLEARLAAWAPKPSDDSANVVAILDPAWKEPTSSVLLSGAAVPLAPAPAATDLVAEAQQLLLDLGFNVGTPDGKLGSRTLAALRQFQQQSGLEVTGELTPEVLDAMRDQAG